MELKIGQRVACYGMPECGSFDCPTIEGDFGVIVGFDPSGWVQVKLDSNYGKDVFLFHPKQCRRIKPRAPRLECWISVKNSDGTLCEAFTRDQTDNMMPGRRCVHMREVRKAKK